MTDEHPVPDLLSFRVFGISWTGHHRLLRWLARADRGDEDQRRAASS